MNILIVGAGSFGTALAQVLSKHNSITLLSRDQRIADSINKKKINDVYFPHILLHDNITAISQIESIDTPNVIILAIPSYATVEAIQNLASHLNDDTLVVNTAKGFAKSGKNILEELQTIHQKSISILGPTFANNLIKGEYSGFTVAAKDVEGFYKVQQTFHDTNVLLDHSANEKAIEMASILKNVFAIAMGLFDSIEDSINTKYLFLTQCYKEMTIILDKFGMEPTDYSKYAVFGDLLLTSLNDQSRNKTFGQLIGRGFYVANHEKRVLFEGERSVKYVNNFARENSLNLPIITFTKEVLNGSNTKNSFSKCMKSI